jgi:hypothetical protein
MNADQMLDYTLGQLDGPARDAFERELGADPVAADRADRVARAVHRLVDDDLDNDAYAPPSGLARSTIAFVAANRNGRRSILEFVPAAVPFRWCDVAVAAGIFIAGLLTLLPPASRARERMAQAGCTYNLQQLGRALWQYGSLHRHYPRAPEQAPNSHSGTYLVMLREDGLISDLGILDCPCNGRCRNHPPVPDLRELLRLQRTNPRLYNETLHSDYAYNISVGRHSAGIERIEADHGIVPLLSDQPDHDGFGIRPGNSPNHGGRGQNVLYSDLHVGWHPTRRISPHDADMYLNRAGQLSPGDDESDAVLSPSLVPFNGCGNVIPVSN